MLQPTGALTNSSHSDLRDLRFLSLPERSQLGISHYHLSFAISFTWRNPDILAPAPLTFSVYTLHRERFVNDTGRVYINL